MKDKYLKLAKLLVEYSCDIKNGEKVLIEANEVDEFFLSILIDEIVKNGGIPFCKISTTKIDRKIMQVAGKQAFKLYAKYMTPVMEEMDAYIGISGGNNIYEFSDISEEIKKDYAEFYSKPIHHDIRVKKTKWVILRWPSQGFAQLAGMSSDSFTDFFFNVCVVDYKTLGERMEVLKNLMDRTSKVRIVGNGTDLTFLKTNIPSVICAGKCNIPDGEIYTAPIKNSVNGHITYNTPSLYSGVKHENIYFEFKDGKIVEAKSNNTKELNAVLDMDEGARYIGEFALGVNPYMNKPITDILFDEKITGSFHFTPGSCYLDAYNGNDSMVHWDLVCRQDECNGGGEIYFDDVLIRKDGKFVLDELKPLNPENFKKQ